MHHIFLRCGWRAFLFERLAHGLVGERVDIGQFHHVLGQKPQRPARLSVGWSRAGERDQVSFLGAIELALVEALATPIGAQRGGKTLFDKALAHALDSRDPGLERLGDARVWPGWPTVGRIGLEQDLSLRTSALPRASSRSSSSRPARVRVTRYFLVIAGLRSRQAPTIRTYNPPHQL